MAKHRCDKEVELSEMHSDIKYIKKAISGNGEPGLMKDVRENSNFRLKLEGMGGLVKFLVGVASSGVIIGIINTIAIFFKSSGGL